jgi:hypothetical protein
MAVQEDHDFANRLLFGPGGENAGGSNRPDALNLAQPVRRRFDDVEDFLPESTHQPLRIGGPNASDHAG